MVEMAPKKLPTKRSRKEDTGSEAIKGWSFLKERRVQLRDKEYAEFQEEIAWRQWTQLISPMAKFDPKIVMEFYANAWPTEEGVRDKYSWVRGQWIPFDEDAINQFLGYPLDFARSVAGRRVRIIRTSMTTLTQIWMTLLLSNILPSDHNSYLPLLKCQLVYAILTQVSVHVAQLILDAIYQFAGITPLRHPMDSEKSYKALGFSTLIIDLCQFYGVPVTPNKLIRPPISRAFIEKYCMPRQAQGQPAANAPLPPLHEIPSLGSISDHLRRLELQMHRYMQHVSSQQAANHRGQDPSPFPWPIPEQFRAIVAWPGDETDFETRARSAGAPGDDEGAQVDDDMADMLDFFT
ncbi:hypothetical protein HKD37_18G050983 [Glycine soja]